MNNMLRNTEQPLLNDMDNTTELSIGVVVVLRWIEHESTAASSPVTGAVALAVAVAPA